MSPAITIFFVSCAVIFFVIVIYFLYFFISRIVEISYKMFNLQKEMTTEFLSINKEMLHQFIRLNALLEIQRQSIQKLEDVVQET